MTSRGGDRVIGAGPSAASDSGVRGVRFVTNLLDLGPAFWEKVAFEDGCWVWTGARSAFGHGRLRNRRAHRVAFAATNDGFDEKKQVLHRCDNPPCVRPSHLFEGTQADNLVDRATKGRARMPKGEDHCFSKLSNRQTRAIRFLWNGGGFSQNRLGKSFGVVGSTISRIVRGEARHG